MTVTPSNVTPTDRSDKGFQKAREEFMKANCKGLVVKRQVTKEVVIKKKEVVTEYVFVPDGKSWKDPKLNGHTSAKDLAKVKGATETTVVGNANDGRILLGSAK
jgi:hypothetical protein